MPDTERYSLLPSNDSGHTDDKTDNDTSLLNAPAIDPRRQHRLLYWIIVAIQSFIILLLVIKLWSNKCGCGVSSQILYSPAQSVLEYLPITFSMGVGHQATVYQGDPSDEVDKAWADLYNDFGISKIPESQARLLPNKTSAIPGEDNYVVALSVFHQLHCLNLIRRSLRPEHYADPETGAIGGIAPEDLPEHLNHCVDNIRQSIMCSADISVIVWKWNDAENTAFPRMDTVHSCRNFNKIVDWAKAHRSGDFNMSVPIKPNV
ncbi:unnamed protein product [Somion occarium]|uniref:Uncharacterized protein n=1 Tax=Somion occarium TaxID=3059160 RepID=A0ABP1DYS0_9APHY